MTTRIGLVLGAGGYAGQAFHAGVLAALEEYSGWDPRAADVVVGTSAGAVVAAWLRAGLSVADLHAYVAGGEVSAEACDALRREREWVSAAAPSPRRLSPASPPLLARLLRRPWEMSLARVVTAAVPRGTRPTGAIVSECDRILGGAWPQEQTLVTAVDLASGWRVVFGGPGQPEATPGEAVAASCAIPGYFAPVWIGDREYIDGAVHSPTNADLLGAYDLDLVFVSSPMSVSRGAGRWSVDLAARLHARRLLGGEVAALRRAGTAVQVFQPCDADLEWMGSGSMDPESRRAVATAARASATERMARAGWLDDLGLRLRESA